MDTEKIKRLRAVAYHDQNGRCAYCGASMWLATPSDFATQYRLSLKQARLLQCTAEHLVARCDGGLDARQNIVAACFWCNQRRHARKTPLDPVRYQAQVSALVRQRRWHSAWAFGPGPTEAGLFKAQSKVMVVQLKQPLTALAKIQRRCLLQLTDISSRHFAGVVLTVRGASWGTERANRAARPLHLVQVEQQTI